MKTRHQLKGLIIGLVIGIMLSSVVLAATASNGTITLENVLMDGITIVIDNKEFTATDANGNVVKPMIYNGTTYVPLRAVSTAFGKAVSWDAETKTAYLGDMDGKLEKPTAKLENLENIAKGAWLSLGIKNNVFDNYGGFYDKAYYCDTIAYNEDVSSCCEYLLNGKYSAFKATFFVPKGATWDTKSYMTIIGDGKVLYPTGEQTSEMDKTSKPIDVEVDITGVNNFKIVFSHMDGIYMGNEGFYQ